MCRHLAYLGPPVAPAQLLIDPPHSLVSQSWAPRRQTHGVVNVDGFGLGWYPPGDPLPARHRAAGPIWADETFAELARVLRTTALLAAVRSATAGMAPGVAAAAPFRAGRWLFSHNGALAGWPGSAATLAASLPVERLLQLDAPTDAALLWALTLDRLERGVSPAEALADVLQQAAKACGGRITLLLHDGERIAAVAYGASLSWRRDGDPSGGAPAPSVVVASEPHDDLPGWHDVPDGHVLLATPETVEVSPL